MLACFTRLTHRRGLHTQGVSLIAVMHSYRILVATSHRNRPKGSVVCLAQVEGLGTQVTSDSAGPTAWQFAV